MQPCAYALYHTVCVVCHIVRPMLALLRYGHAAATTCHDRFDRPGHIIPAALRLFYCSSCTLLCMLYMLHQYVQSCLSPSMQARALLEAAISSNLTHTHIVSTYAYELKPVANPHGLQLHGMGTLAAGQEGWRLHLIQVCGFSQLKFFVSMFAC